MVAGNKDLGTKDSQQLRVAQSPHGYPVVVLLLILIGILSVVVSGRLTEPVVIQTVLPHGAAASEVQTQVRATLAANIDPADPHEEIRAEIERRTEEIVDELFPLDETSDFKKSLTEKVQQAIDAAFQAGAFQPRVASDRLQNELAKAQKSRLYREILLNFVFADSATSAVPTDEQLEQIRDRIAVLFDFSDSESHHDEILQRLTIARDQERLFQLKGKARQDGLLQLLSPPKAEAKSPGAPE